MVVDIKGHSSNAADDKDSNQSDLAAEHMDLPVPPIQQHPPVDEAKLLRKIDWHLLPILFAIYVLSFLDRVNISNALTMGLPEELNLGKNQPNIALCIFFAPYILFEIPSNIAMKRWSPRIWLSANVAAFGIVMLCQGFVQNYEGLLATRFLLGLFETGIFPGSFYLISFWYKQEESQKRFSVYWSTVICAGAFGGLLASAIANMDGLGGLSNWRWVFILEGAATILVGILAFFTITDFPKEAIWLSETERDFILAKTGEKESHTVPLTARDVLHFFTKPKHWVAAVMYFALLVPAYSITYFLPTIVRTLGYSTVQTQLHSVPPFAAAFGLIMILSYLSDKTRMRSPFIFFGLALLVTGLAILVTVNGPGNFSTQYAGICLVAMGTFGIGGLMVCWYVMNLRGHVERSIGSAWLICFGNCGGVVATFLFKQEDAPRYLSGYSVCLSMAALCVASSMGYLWFAWRDKRAEGARSPTGSSQVCI